MEVIQSNKQHRAPRAGRKAKKKEIQRKKKLNIPIQKQVNEKEFAFRYKQEAVDHQRTLDKQEQKLHFKIPQRTYYEEPPKIVAIVGPPKVSKLTYS